MTDSPLLRAPVEVRMLIYAYLFTPPGADTAVRIRNGGAGKQAAAGPGRTRTRYWALDRSIHRRSYETTYICASFPSPSPSSSSSSCSPPCMPYHRTQAERNDPATETEFCAPLLRTCRLVYNETTPLVYGAHPLDFGGDVEALAPFFADLTPASRRLVRQVRVARRAPAAVAGEGDRARWRGACAALRGAFAPGCGGEGEDDEEEEEREKRRRSLVLTVHGGRPAEPWDGPARLSAAEIKLLADVKHDALEWTAELVAQLRGLLGRLEVRAQVGYCRPAVSSNMIVFAALSASIETGLAQFLRSELGVA
ncbi:hypothetical protein F4780DRAFT_794577 [Xylariomycetidae sp. FL0641]|nr:hypothetical protein F4780DRAFT_794577 [Xylariomycetidae sp. FL0641]